jgi:hypothetical protein
MSERIQMRDVQFAKSYVDRLFAEKDMMLLHHSISVIERDRQFPEEFWLFCRVLEWIGYTRSGIWQYYEGVEEGTFQRISEDLDRFGLVHIAEKYRFGRTVWNEPAQIGTLDDWIEEHEHEINDAILNLILPKKECLYPD